MAKSNGNKANFSAPYPGTRYNPPPPSKEPGQATHQDSVRAVELLRTDTRQVYVNGPGPARQT